MHYFRVMTPSTGMTPALPSSHPSDELSPALGGTLRRALGQSPDEIDAWINCLKAGQLAGINYGVAWVGAPHGYMPWNLDGDLCDSMVDLTLMLESGQALMVSAQYASPPGRVAVADRGLRFDFVEPPEPSSDDIDVSNKSRWTSLIGRSVAEVDVYWEAELSALTGDEQWAPTEVELIFEWGQSILVAWSRTAQLAGLPATVDEDLYVIFDETIAKRYSLGAYYPATHA